MSPPPDEQAAHSKTPWRLEEGMDDVTWTDIVATAGYVGGCYGLDRLTRYARRRLHCAVL